MRKLLFVSVGSHLPEGQFYLEVGKRLFANYKVSIIALSRYEINTLHHPSIDVFSVHKWLSQFETLSEEKIQQEIDRIPEQYNIPSLRWIYMSSRANNRHSPQVMLRKTIAYFLAWEKIIEELQPDVILSDFGGELLRRVAYYVASKYRISYFWLDWSPISGMFGIHTSEANHWTHLRVADSPLPSDAQAQVEAYLQKVYQQRLSPVRFWKPQITGNRVKRLFDEVKREIVVEKGEHDHFTPRKWVKEYFLRLIKRPIITPRYEDPVPGEKYIFFPLHVPDDAQLTVRAPYYQNQAALLRWVVRSLPDGYKLYIKEHPAFIAKYMLNTYRQFDSLPHTRLISPYVHPHDIIQQAQAVITINSTAGFESLLFHKPVIVLGPVSYRGYGATIDVTNLAELPEAVKQSLEAPPPKWKIDRLIWSMMQASYPGHLYDYNETNLDSVADAIHQKIISRFS